MKKYAQIFCLTALVVACKPHIAPDQAEIAGDSDDDIKVCKPKIDSGDKFGFKFKATSLNFGNAYWAALASSFAYKNRILSESAVTHWVDPNAPKVGFTSYGYDPTGKKKISRTQAFWADFAAGSILSFRGTDGIRDLITDARVLRIGDKALDEYSEDLSLGELKIHKGFWNALEEEVDWDGSGKKMKLWDKILANHISSTPTRKYSLSIPEERQAAFRAVDRALQGVIQTVDVQDAGSDEKFKPFIDTLKSNGHLIPDVNNPKIAKTFDEEIRIAVNIWSDTTGAIAKALARAKGNLTDPVYLQILAKETKRQDNQFLILHKYWVYHDYRPLWLTGHSLGGALATLAAYRLMSMGVPVQGVITFGSPNVGNRVFSSYVRRRFIREGVMLNVNRFQNNNDGVSRVPNFLGWQAVGSSFLINEQGTLLIPRQNEDEERIIAAGLKEYSDSEKMRRYYDGSQNPPGYKGIWTFALESFISDHSMTQQYLAHLRKYTFGSACGD